MAEERKVALNSGLLALGMLFFFGYVVMRYYLVYLGFQGLLTPALVSVRDSMFGMGIVVSAGALTISSAGFQKDESRIITYVYALTAVLFITGLYLNALKSPLGIYLIYNSGIILVITAAFIPLGYLGLRGKMISLVETDRVAIAALAGLLAFSLAVSFYAFSIQASGRLISKNMGILETHSLRYAAWTAIAVLAMRFSKPSERLNRLITYGLITAAVLWAFTFTGYTLGLQMQMASGAMDFLLGATILAAALSLWGLKGERGQVTPQFALGSLAFIWFMIAGAIGLYLVTNFSVYQGVVPAGWRLFHLMNANLSLTAGVGAVGLAATGSSRRLGWVITILFSAGMVQAVVSYLLSVIDPTGAAMLISAGEPFMGAAFLATAYVVFRFRRVSEIPVKISET